MTIAQTEHDLMAVDIADFTDMIVKIVGLDIPAQLKADSIVAVERVFHKFIMNKIVSKCQNVAAPSSN